MLVKLLKELFGPDCISTITPDDAARFREMRELRKEVDRTPIIELAEGVEALHLQIEFALSFCDTVLCYTLPPLDINIGYRKCKVLDNGRFVYMISTNQGHIDAGKKLGLEVVDV